MKIHTPGFPTQYVDETPPDAAPASDFPDVEQAIALANQRSTQVLKFDSEPLPLIDHEAEERAKVKAEADAAAIAATAVKLAEVLKAAADSAVVPTGTDTVSPTEDLLK